MNCLVAEKSTIAKGAFSAFFVQRKWALGPFQEGRTVCCRGRPMLRGTISPSERSLCDHRFVVDSGTPSASVIFLLPRPWAAISIMAKSFSRERTMMHAKCSLTFESWDK